LLDAATLVMETLVLFPAGRLWYDSITNTIRVSDGHTPGGQIVTGQAGAYTLPTATPSVKGGVQLGANIIATGASIDVLQPTQVSQLENDANYLSGAVLATYATQTFVTTQGYITSAALSSGNANVIAANSTIQSISANLGAYQIWANTNVTTLTSNAGVQGASINRLDANIGAYQTWANTEISSRDANLGTATTNISNLVTQANANTTALIRGSVTTGPLTVDSPTGGYFANISAYGRAATGRQSWQFYVNQSVGGPGSWIQFPDSTNQYTAYPGTSTTLADFNANIGTLYLGNIDTQANLGAYQTYANTTDATTQANLGAFYNYANSKIGTNTDSTLISTGGNIFVPGYSPGGGTTINKFGIYNEAVDQNQVFQISTNGLKGGGHWAGGGGLNVFSSAEITFRLGTTLRSQNTPTGGTPANGQNITFSSAGQVTIGNTQPSTSTSTGALIISNGGAGIAGNVNIGGNIALGGNIAVAGNLIASGYSNVSITTGSLVNRSALTISGNVYGRGGVGYLDAVQLTNNYSAATNPNKYIRVNSAGSIEIINNAYSATLLTLTDAGALSVASTMSSTGFYVNNKQAVNGPAFRAYIAGSQTITSGSQQKVTFGTETFDTNSNFASSTFTPTVEGYYQLNATVRISGPSSTGECMLIIWKNGSEYARGTNESGTEQGASFYSMQVSDLVYANGTSDYFEIYIQQTSGSNRDTTAGQNISYFSGAMIRGA
jgi:hypothetical protein